MKSLCPDRQRSCSRPCPRISSRRSRLSGSPPTSWEAVRHRADLLLIRSVLRSLNCEKRRFKAVLNSCPVRDRYSEPAPLVAVEANDDTQVIVRMVANGCGIAAIVGRGATPVAATSA